MHEGRSMHLLSCIHSNQRLPLMLVSMNLASILLEEVACEGIFVSTHMILKSSLASSSMASIVVVWVISASTHMILWLMK